MRCPNSNDNGDDINNDDDNIFVNVSGKINRSFPLSMNTYLQY